MNYKGVIIEESLSDKSVLKGLKILNTEIEKVTKEHKTPWLAQWTMHTVEISENEIDIIADRIRSSMDLDHEWYADFKNDNTHFIIFRNKVFKVDRKNKEQYDNATKYGISIGIPEYQVDFSPYIKMWGR
ncbi:MAG: hypothetical protein WC470_01150 [Candidatus Paceibacterota bacterium]